MKSWITSSLIVAIVASAGCGSDGSKVDLGDDKVARTGEKLSDYAGDWHGYAEAFHFNDGSDAIAIKLDARGEGVIEVGESDPLPPPDPDEAYPPFDSDPAQDPFAKEPLIQGLVSGFSYPISGAKVESKRIQFESSTAEVVREWCELQTPVLDEVNVEEEHWLCLPNVGYQTGPDGCFLGGEDHSMPIPCGKVACSLTCECTKSGCEASGGPDVQFDAALESEGDELVGTLVVDERITVRLTRD